MDAHEENLVKLQEDSDNYLKQLRKQLNARLRVSSEAQIRELEMKIHAGIAQART